MESVLAAGLHLSVMRGMIKEQQKGQEKRRMVLKTESVLCNLVIT